MLRENNLLRGGDRANDSRFLEKYAYKADTGESFDRFNGILTGGTCNCVGVLSLSKPGGFNPSKRILAGKKYIYFYVKLIHIQSGWPIIIFVDLIIYMKINMLIV